MTYVINFVKFRQTSKRYNSVTARAIAKIKGYSESTSKSLSRCVGGVLKFEDPTAITLGL